RVVDWLPIGYSVGVLVMLLNNRSRRLGDFAGGTLVVREGARRALSTLTPPSTSRDAPRGYTLSSADATLVRDFLVRREGMDPSARADLAQRLATALAQRYQLPVEAGSDPEPFLEQL
ncbi:MAG: RDD family protein, partial [Chloroflexi bacterium]|nr:RDD family protein [Chloroflexota bacterium]